MIKVLLAIGFLTLPGIAQAQSMFPDNFLKPSSNGTSNNNSLYGVESYDEWQDRRRDDQRQRQLDRIEDRLDREHY